jgi:hypothetical protein
MEDKLDVARRNRIAEPAFGQKEPEPPGKNNGNKRTKRKRRVEDEERKRFLNLRDRAFNYVVKSSWINGAAVLLIVLLQGFHLGGFNLPREILYALLVATIGKVAESLIIDAIPIRVGSAERMRKSTNHL